MERINSDLIELGMKFSAPVFFDDGKNMFLPEKKPVRKFHIETLKRWAIPYVVTQGRLLANTAVDLDELLSTDASDVEELESETGGVAELEEADTLTDDTKGGVNIRSVIGKIDENPLFVQYVECIAAMSVIFDGITSNRTQNVSQQLQTVSASLYALVEQNPSFVTSFLFAGEVKRQDFAVSAVNTAIITFLVAKKLAVPQNKIKLYVTGALLHDIGMLLLPSEILTKKEQLAQQEFTRLKMHTIEGSRKAGELFHAPTDVINIVLQHHEHWDGEGYPYAIKKNEISQGAAIVALADAFEAMITEKSYRTSMLGYQAMKNLLADNCRHFSPDVVKAFIQSMGVYPIGSLVLLNDGSIARVIEGNENTPLRPVVRILVSAEGECFNNNSGPTLQLETFKKVFIVRALDSKELHGKIE